MTDRSSCYIRYPNARNCRRRRGNLPDLMLCDGLWKVLCISPWRLVYAFPQAVVEREPRAGRCACSLVSEVDKGGTTVTYGSVLNRSLNMAPAQAKLLSTLTPAVDLPIGANRQCARRAGLILISRIVLSNRVANETFASSSAAPSGAIFHRLRDFSFRNNISLPCTTPFFTASTKPSSMSRASGAAKPPDSALL